MKKLACLLMVCVFVVLPAFAQEQVASSSISTRHAIVQNMIAGIMLASSREPVTDWKYTMALARFLNLSKKYEVYENNKAAAKRAIANESARLADLKEQFIASQKELITNLQKTIVEKNYFIGFLEKRIAQLEGGQK